jgi:hypothetical protein
VSFAAKRAFDWIKSSINQSINQSVSKDGRFSTTLVGTPTEVLFCFILIIESNLDSDSDSVDSVVF